MSVRVGLIDYLNPGPFYWDLGARLGTGAELVRAVPAELNRALLDGRLDASIVSAHFVAEHAPQLLVLPGHSVSARGAVQSVLLLSWHDSLAALAGREVVVTSSSASAVNLLRVLFEERCVEPPRLSTMAPVLDTMLAGAEAALVIGDNALREWHLRRTYVDPRGRRRRPHVFDLAGEWLALTGHPFTFALWAVRRDAAARVRALGLAEHLAASKAGGLANLEAIARRGAAELDLPPEVCLAYLRNLEFGFDPPFRAGFEAFLDRAFPAGARPRIELA